MREEAVGGWERENGDVFFLAWLMKLQMVKGDPPKLGAFMKSANLVAMSFKQRANENAKLTAAYQFKEDEEKDADLLGHSLLSRAGGLAALQDDDTSFLLTNTIKTKWSRQVMQLLLYLVLL